IVGAGIVGASTALYAARAGLKVILLDKGAIGFEQSTRNWGWVHQQVRYPHLIPLAMQSRRIWETLEQDLGADLEWRQGGNLNIAGSPEAMAGYEGYQRAAADTGLDVELLSAAQVADRLPGIRGGVLGGLFIPSDGQANPHRVTRAFVDAAVVAGATLLQGCAVHSILISSAGVQGVVTERGSLLADQVLVAAGAWSRRLLKPLGIALPQNAIRSTVIRTTPAPPYTQATGWAPEVAFRQDAAGRFVLASGARSTFDINLDALTDIRQFGATAWQFRRELKLAMGRPLIRDLLGLIPGTRTHASPWAALRSNEPPPDLEAAAPNLEGFARLLPRFADLAVEKIWAGNIDMTPDQAPVIDNRTPVPGLVIATGFSGHGFAMGPAGGLCVSQLLQGRAADTSLHAFRLARFAEGDLPEMPDFYP
ncbi:MAG: FAD-binding oxidoreductase, partial [Pseudomonadales bacterium]|nr:FAD-binding oxidoreductase [Pseudomonadales bacterium]